MSTVKYINHRLFFLSRRTKDTSIKEALLADSTKRENWSPCILKFPFLLDLSCQASFVLDQHMTNQDCFRPQGININPDYCNQGIHTSIKISLYFFGFTPTLRSRSNVAFWRVLQQTGLHRLIDLQLACEYHLDLYCPIKLHQLIDLL